MQSWQLENLVGRVGPCLRPVRLSISKPQMVDYLSGVDVFCGFPKSFRSGGVQILKSRMAPACADAYPHLEAWSVYQGWDRWRQTICETDSEPSGWGMTAHAARWLFER